MSSTRHKPTPCPTCGTVLKVETRGPSAWIARCPGGNASPDKLMGCHAEFGDSPVEAIERVLENVL